MVLTDLAKIKSSADEQNLKGKKENKQKGKKKRKRNKKKTGRRQNQNIFSLHYVWNF